MKIENSLNPLLNKDTKAATGQRPTVAPETVKAEETARGDVVQLSERSRLIARSQELAAGAPEVREDKVNDIRSRLAAGTYTVSGRTVADSLLKKSITEV